MKLTNLRAADLLAIATSAKTVADIDPVVAEFERRMNNRAAKVGATAGAKGEAANKSILGHVANNLSRVQEMRAKLAKPAPAKKPAKKAEASDPAYAFLSTLDEKQLAALRAMLAK
jgi:hypothetical protein